MNELPEVFYACDRYRAKAHADDTLTQEYITRLEAVALAAWVLYQQVPHAGFPLRAHYANALYDALATINFLDEDL